MLSYKTIGKGKPLLLIHGFGISFKIWREITPLLKDDFNLVIIELPGIDKSHLGLNKSNYFEYSSEQIELLRKKAGY